MAKKIKTEHAGAKNGGGYWGRRADAKERSKKLRRTLDRKVVVKIDARVAADEEQCTHEHSVTSPPMKVSGMTASWRDLKWGDIATLEYGKSLRDYENARGRFRVFGTNGPIGWHDHALCPRPGVIVGRKGAYRGIHYSPEPFFVIDTAFFVIPKESLNTRWIYYALMTYDINRMDSGSAIPSTSRDSFYQLPVRVPPPTEQSAIAHILGTLDDKIELNRRMNETLETMARALFKLWFVDFDPVRAKAAGRNPGQPKYIADLFPDSFEDSELGEIPKGWQVGSVDEEFDLTMGQSPPGETYNEVGTGLPFYQGCTDFGFRFPTRRIYCTAPTRLGKAGDALVSVRAPVGDINMATEDCAIGRGVDAVRHKTGSRSYSYQFMKSIKEVFARFDAEGTVFGSIGKKDFHAITSVNPPRDLVLAFEAQVLPLDDRVENNERESRTLAALRGTLLPKLISGELRVKDAERMVSEAAE